MLSLRKQDITKKKKVYILNPPQRRKGIIHALTTNSFANGLLIEYNQEPKEYLLGFSLYRNLTNKRSISID